MNDYDKNLVYFLALSIAINFSIASFLINTNNTSQREFRINSISSDSATQLCTASVNSWTFLCDSQSYAIEINATTEDRLQKAINECPTGKFIETKGCIGKYIVIIGTGD